MLSIVKDLLVETAKELVKEQLKRAAVWLIDKGLEKIKKIKSKED